MSHVHRPPSPSVEFIKYIFIFLYFCLFQLQLGLSDLALRPPLLRKPIETTVNDRQRPLAALCTLDTMYASPSVPRPLPPSPYGSLPPPLPENFDPSPSHSQPGSSRPSFSNEAPRLPPIALWDGPPRPDGNHTLGTPVDSTQIALASSPISPSIPTDGQARAKRANPLQDLLDSEDQYVQLISAIIRVRTMNIPVINAHYHSSHNYLESRIRLVPLKLSAPRT